MSTLLKRPLYSKFSGSDDPKDQDKNVYQFINAVVFCLPRFIGTWYLRRYYNGITRCTLPVFRKEKEDGRAYFDSVQTYLYFYFIKAMLFGQKQAFKDLEFPFDLSKFDGIPILFICSGEGWQHDDGNPYHSKKYKKFIQERDYCKYVQFDDCNHWLMDEKVGNPQRLNNEIYQFLQK